METVLVMEKLLLLLRVSARNESAPAASLENTVCGMQTSHWTYCYSRQSMLWEKKTRSSWQSKAVNAIFRFHNGSWGVWHVFGCTHAKMWKVKAHFLCKESLLFPWKLCFCTVWLWQQCLCSQSWHHIKQVQFDNSPGKSVQLLQLKLTICLSVPDIILVSPYFGITVLLNKAKHIFRGSAMEWGASRTSLASQCLKRSVVLWYCTVLY